MGGRALLEEGKKWYYQPYGDALYSFELFLQGDTVVDGHACKKLYETSAYLGWNPSLKGILYEEDKKVYCKRTGESEWMLLFDFSLETGAQVQVDMTDYSRTATLERVDYVTFNGEEYRRMVFSDYTNRYRPVIVEGVGGWKDMFHPYLLGSWPDVYLASCEVDGKEIFNYHAFMQDLEHKEPNENFARVNGLKYLLNLQSHEAMLASDNVWAGSLTIPSAIECGGQTYAVTGILHNAFKECATLTEVVVPASIRDIRHFYGSDVCRNPFEGASGLEKVVVEDGNQWLSSVDGVLFSKDMTELYCYPAARPDKDYAVPEQVSLVREKAFVGSQHLKTLALPRQGVTLASRAFEGCTSMEEVNMPSDLSYVSEGLFDGCTALRKLDLPPSVRMIGNDAFSKCAMDSLIIRGQFYKKNLGNKIFSGLNPSTTLYVHWGEVDKFKTVYAGTVLPCNKGVAEDSYYPMLKDGKVWNLRRSDGTLISLRIDGDTLIGRNKFFKMYTSGDTDGLLPKRTLWREVERRVGCGWPEGMAFHYHFGMKLEHGILGGDTQGEIICDGVDCVSLNGHDVRLLTMKGSNGELYRWQEGIGNVEWGPFFPYGPTDPALEMTLLSVYEDGKCIFIREEGAEPSGVSATDREPLRTGTCFDLQGRRLNGVPQRGMYIRDGRKYVVK